MEAFWRGKKKTENVVAVLQRKARFPDGKLGCVLKPWRLYALRTGFHWTHISKEQRI